MRKILLVFCLCFLFVSCEFLPIIGEILIELNNASNQNTESDYSEDTTDDTTIDHIRKKALEYAQEYCRVDTEYYYGGQDMIRAIKVDCSGMVINCYKYAIANTGYKLLFDDTTAANLYSKFSDHTTNPKPGDLIFMGDTNSKTVNHIGIFVKKQGSTVYFIDATEGKGVAERNYDINNSKIKGFGSMKFSVK